MNCPPKEDDPCYTCGSANLKELICPCSRCGDRQHLWCMIPMLLDIQSPWFCHECQMRGSSFSPTKVRDDVSLPGVSTIPSVPTLQHQKMRMNEPKSGKVKFLPASEAACLLPNEARNCLLPILTPVRKRSQRRGKTTSALRISSPVKPSAPVRDFCQLMKTLRENRGLKGMRKKTTDTFTRKVSPIIPDGGSPEKKFKGCENESNDKLKPNELGIIGKFTKNPVNTDAIWSGQIEILDDPDHGIYSGLHAFSPRWVHIKTYFFSLSLPSVLSFKLISRNLSWDEFKDSPPDENCVALYMLPEFSDRCREPYQHLLNMLDSSDYAMHTYINGVELIVYTSKWLKMTCEESEEKNFLWGLYRVHECIAIDKECNNAIEPNAHEEKVKESNIPIIIDDEEMNVVKDMQLDMVDRKGTVHEEVIVLNKSKSIGYEGTRKLIKDELFEVECPPGFEAQHWWKKRKA